MARKLLPIADFAKAGLNSDLMPWDLPGNFLTDIRNIRIIRGKLVPFGGYSVLSTLPNATMVPGSLQFVNSTSGKFWIVMANNSVWALNPTPNTWDDISLAGGYTITDPEAWTSCMLTNIPVLNHPSSVPQYWNPQALGTDLTELPWDATTTWSEAGESCRIIRSHKQFLFALDLVSSTYGEIPDGVRWSSPADINGVPNSWDELDVTNVAGLTTLGGTGGRIVDGLGLRDAFVVYRENSITVFDYVQNSSYVWRIRELMSTVGAVSANCIAEVKGKHYFIGDGDILVNDGNTVKSLLHNRIRKRFVANYDVEYFRNSYVVKNSVAYEIWFCIPETGNQFPNIAYIYNWRDDTWAIRDIPVSPFASYGNQASLQLTWSSVPGSWATTPLLWTQSQLTPLDDSIVAVTQPSGGTPGQLLILDKTVEGNAVPFDSKIERTGFALEGINKTTTICTVYPHVSGSGKLYIRLGSQDFPGAPTRWKNPVLFDPTAMRKVDMRTTGELHCFQLYTENSSEEWAISGMDVEYVDAGTR
jgi:hypothetical protein